MGSQIGDERPISQVRFSPNSELLVTGSWSGGVKLWNVPSCTLVRSLRGVLTRCMYEWFISYFDFVGHSDRVGGIAWHPRATLSQESNTVNLVSGAGDYLLHLWSLDRYDTNTHSLNPSSHLTRGKK